MLKLIELATQYFPTHPPELKAGILRQLRTFALGNLPKIDTPGGIDFYPLYSGSQCVIGLFVLAQGAAIPTHDHPGMHVFSKVIKGCAEIHSYCTTSDLKILEHRTIEAKEDDLLMADEEYNMHEITAKKELWLLDVMDVYGDSKCTYYTKSEDATKLVPINDLIFEVNTKCSAI